MTTTSDWESDLSKPRKFPPVYPPAPHEYTGDGGDRYELGALHANAETDIKPLVVTKKDRPALRVFGPDAWNPIDARNEAVQPTSQATAQTADVHAPADREVSGSRDGHLQPTTVSLHLPTPGEVRGDAPDPLAKSRAEAAILAEAAARRKRDAAQQKR